MGLMEEIEKGIQKVMDFLEIGEPHHSEPINQPRGLVSQVMTNRGAGFTAKSMTVLGELLPHTPEESDYLYRTAKPKRRDQI